MPDVLIAGGGLAGLTASIRLARAGFSTVLIEKRSYPHHKVCGEYVSNEVLDFLQREKLLTDMTPYPGIRRFQLTSENGRHAEIQLNLGGFGISRYRFDHQLYELALKSGVKVLLDEVTEIMKSEDDRSFNTSTSGGKTIESTYVLGAFGKRSKIDKLMDRRFMRKRSPWVAVKYHIDYEVAEDMISLHNFAGGYCGISKIENGVTNLCYLTKRDNLQRYGSVSEMEQNVLCNNPFLKDIFSNAKFLFEKPLVINEVSFSSKRSVENGVIMIGDSAGLIAPLCGNGMAMAIHSGKMISDLLITYYERGKTRHKIEALYQKNWKKEFKSRLWLGRTLQGLFGQINSSNRLVDLIRFQPKISAYLINKTHGKII